MAACSLGVVNSSASLLFFVDADCRVDKGAFSALLRGFARPTVGVVAARSEPQPGLTVNSLVERSGIFSALVLHETKSRLVNHDFLPIGRLMALRRAAWQAGDDQQRPCDRIVASRAKRAGWEIIYMPEAVVYYQPVETYDELWSAYIRSVDTHSRARLVGDWAEPLPRGAVCRAAAASVRRQPLSAAAWLALRARLWSERVTRAGATGRGVRQLGVGKGCRTARGPTAVPGPATRPLRCHSGDRVTVLDADPGELISGRAVRSRPRHRRPQGQAPPRRAGGLGRAPAVAVVVHVLAAFALMPVAGHPYDLAALSGPSGAWLRWGVPLFDHWKFGFDLSILAVGSQSLSFVLEHLGMSGAAALAVAWKLPLVLADLLVGAVLVDLGRQLRCQRPALMATLWLISPVPLWVSAGHGQIESLTDFGYRAVSGPALAPPTPAGRGCRGAGHRHRVPSSFGRDRCHLLALCRRSSNAGRFIALSAGCAVALAFCFGPLLSTDIGRTSLLGGLSFSADAASHPGHAQAASPVGSSLWAVFDLSPGPFWLAAASSTSVALHDRARAQGEKRRQHSRSQTARNIGGWWPSSLRDPLRSRGAPTVLRPRPRWTVHRWPLCGSEPGSHRSRTVSSAGSWTHLRLRRQLSELLVRHVGNDKSERLAVPAESPGGRLGGPARCRWSSHLACYSRPLMCSERRSRQRLRTLVARSVNRRWSAWHRRFLRSGRCSRPSGRELDHRDHQRWQISP